jgi:Flp pilus assembly protein TadG
MKHDFPSLRRQICRRIYQEDRGQALVIVVLMMTLLLGFGGLTIDAGHVYFSYRQLQAATDAAALAGGRGLPNYAATVANVTKFSSLSGQLNATGNLNSSSLVSGYPAFECLTTLTNKGIPCVSTNNPSNTSQTANAVQVKETVTIPTPFMALLGRPSIAMTATATAQMTAKGKPYNVVIMVDTTASMQDTDSGSNCNSSRLTCALNGVITLLQELDPCPTTASSCANTTNPVDTVALFTFPNMTYGTVSKQYDCTSTNPTIAPYTFPSSTATSYQQTSTPTSTTPTYQVTPYLTTYRTSDTAASLNTSSTIVEAIGGKSGCTGMADPGGEGTYYAGAIYAAQASLTYQQSINPTANSQNVLILISDGDAGTTTSGAMAGASTTSGTYPSTKNQCAQAVTAAQYAASQGTRVYAVAYGAESSGCGTDTSGITPCQTMQQIASSTAYFYSDYQQSGSGADQSCIGTANSTTNINQIFGDIAATLSVTKLIPDGTT